MILRLLMTPSPEEHKQQRVGDTEQRCRVLNKALLGPAKTSTANSQSQSAFKPVELSFQVM